MTCEAATGGATGTVLGGAGAGSSTGTGATVVRHGGGLGAGHRQAIELVADQVAGDERDHREPISGMLRKRDDAHEDVAAGAAVLDDQALRSVQVNVERAEVRGVLDDRGAELGRDDRADLLYRDRQVGSDPDDQGVRVRRRREGDGDREGEGAHEPGEERHVVESPHLSGSFCHKFDRRR